MGRGKEKKEKKPETIENEARRKYEVVWELGRLRRRLISSSGQTSEVRDGKGARGRKVLAVGKKRTLDGLGEPGEPAGSEASLHDGLGEPRKTAEKKEKKQTNKIGKVVEQNESESQSQISQIIRKGIKSSKRHNPGELEGEVKDTQA